MKKPAHDAAGNEPLFPFSSCPIAFIGGGTFEHNFPAGVTKFSFPLELFVARRIVCDFETGARVMIAPLPAAVSSSPFGEFLQFGERLVEIASGRSVDAPNFSFEDREHLVDLLQRLGKGFGLILEGHSDRWVRVLGPQDNLTDDLVELVRKSGLIPLDIQQLANQLDPRGVDEPNGDHARDNWRFHDCILLLALPLKDCMSSEAGKSS